MSDSTVIESYNPCFSGSSSATVGSDNRDPCQTVGYNPCFSGSSSATERYHGKQSGLLVVTILVFLAALVQQPHFFSNR